MEPWNRGEMYISKWRRPRGEKKADETGLELIVVKELLEAITLAHIVALF